MLAALAPFHPRLVHFPIALAVVGALFLALGLIRRHQHWIDCGQFSLLLGWFGVMTAIVTGLIDQSAAPDDPVVRAVINQHITFGIALLIAIGLALYWPLRNKRLFSAGQARLAYSALLLCIITLTIIEGWLGGKLVYHYQVGIR